ncbi:MAG: SUMF1/EgtB/PvdO family nonheme iron enzyme [Caldilineales bacterium]|nr:SUMF1/EgtB/PvdO family nonheme iron enzyme [Caldilineales bacterium]
MPSPDPQATSYRDVHAQTFVGRDLHLDVQFSGAEMEALLAELLALLRSRDVQVANGSVSAGERGLTVSLAQADALGRYLAAAPPAGPAEREACYLARLCITPDIQRLQQRYVMLSGGYRPPPELAPAFSQLLVKGEGPQRQIERVPLPDIRQALDEHPAFILLAQPGGGKTTVLRRLALDLALRRLQVTARPAPSARLPLFVRLASQQPHETPEAFLSRMWRGALPGGSEAEFHERLQAGQLCLLCDALNEALRERYSERMWAWRDFARDLPAGNRLVFSCRSQDHQGELAVQQVEIDPLTPDQIEDFARRYLGPEGGAGLWRALQEEHRDLLELAAIPYYLLMIVGAYDQAQGELPAGRAGLFEGFVGRLLHREEHEQRHPDWIEAQAQALALTELAFAMQKQGSGTELALSEALAALPEKVTLPDGRSVATPPATVLHLAQEATLLAETPEHKVKFLHHLLQEYFAGLALLRRWRDGEDLAELWRTHWRRRDMPAARRGEWDPLPPPPATGWEETTLLAASLIPELAAAVRTANPALAARCLLAGGETEGERLAAARQDMLARLGDPAAHLRSRIEAGLLLGRLGDPRFPVETVNGVKVILPPLVEIAGGPAAIGSGWWNLRVQADERPRHTVPLAPYALGRFPVTNAEFECFRAAGGYDEERYWTAGGKHWRRGEPAPGEDDPAEWWLRTWQRRKDNPSEIDERLRSGLMTARDARNWREYITWPEEDWLGAVRQLYPEGQRFTEPRFWQDLDFNNPSQPVVGVCWYEAAAYANWLGAVTGLPFRLPSEPEWEWAARGGSRPYPWGWRWADGRLNSLEGRVLRTTPVGVYPQGSTPDGLHELAGNVYEWTATRYAPYPYDPDAALEDPDAAGPRVGRGGGWAADRRLVRCAFRYWYSPGDWYLTQGFRVARILSA